MYSTIHFYEIDSGPGGPIWEGRVGDEGPYLGSFRFVQEVIEMARVFSLADHPIRFHTQAEWQLDSRLEEVLDG